MHRINQLESGGILVVYKTVYSVVVLCKRKNKPYSAGVVRNGIQLSMGGRTTCFFCAHKRCEEENNNKQYENRKTIFLHQSGVSDGQQITKVGIYVKRIYIYTYRGNPFQHCQMDMHIFSRSLLKKCIGYFFFFYKERRLYYVFVRVS